MNKIHYAVVGTGSIGRRHCAVLDAEPRAVISSVFDTDTPAAQKQAELYAVPQVATTYQELLSNPQVQVVNVCTPHHLHAAMSIAAAEAGKHILVEKPMALTTADCQRMIDAAQANDVSLTVMKQNRFNVPVKLVSDALESGKLGRIFMVQCNVLWNRHQGYYNDSPWRGNTATEGGALFTQVSHFLDLLIWWFGEPRLTGGSKSTLNHDIEVEDCGLATLKFPNQAEGSISWTTCVYNKNYEGSITIIGEKGTVKIGGKYLNLIEYWDVQAYPLPENINMVDTPNNYGKYQGTSSNHDKVVANHIAMLLGEPHIIVDGAEGMKTISLIEDFYRL